MNGELPRWGKAGQRLTEQEADARIQRRRHQQLETEAARRQAYQEWAAGKLVPARITLALDRRGLVGPEVDEACGAREPDVDHWEAGLLYPTWEQVEALAELTNFPVGWFVQPVQDWIRLHDTSMWFHLHPAERDAYTPQAPVLAFPAEVVDARMRGEPSPLRPQFHDQLELFGLE